MKRIVIISVLACSLCSSLAYGENALLSEAFWKTATVKDVNSAVANGADVNARYDEEYTALFIAASVNTNPEVVEELVKLGADVNASRIASIKEI